jgi:hypothetical protein
VAYSPEKRGYLLLINNILNSNSSDILRIRNTFHNCLKFNQEDIDYQENINNKQISELTKHIAIHNARNHDFFICIILAHKKNFIPSSDDDSNIDDNDDEDNFINIQNIVKQYDLYDGFTNKPKLFFLNAYGMNNCEEFLTLPITLTEDFFYAYSAIKRTKNINKTESSFFKKFCQSLQDSTNSNSDLCEIMTEVNQFVPLEEGNSFFVSNLRDVVLKKINA